MLLETTFQGVISRPLPPNSPICAYSKVVAGTLIAGVSPSKRPVLRRHNTKTALRVNYPKGGHSGAFYMLAIRPESLAFYGLAIPYNEPSFLPSDVFQSTLPLDVLPSTTADAAGGALNSKSF